LPKTLVIILLFLSLRVFSNVCSASDSDQQAEGLDLLKKAASIENLRTPDGKPFHLQMKIHAKRIVAKPIDGTYDEIWISPDKWHREIAMPGFSQVEVGDRNSKWVSRNLDFRPRVASLTTAAVEGFMAPDLSAGEKISSRHEKKKNGTILTCLEMKSEHSPPRELCFDPSGPLVSLDRGNQQIEYDGFSKFGDKVVPHSIRIWETGV
jgi:hypothetical protein